MKVSRAAVATVAACLTVGLAGAPSASAAAQDDSATAKSAQSGKTVNRRLNSTRRSLSRTNRRLTTTRRQVATARRNISKITLDLGAVARRLQSAEGGVGLLLGAAPQLINSLTQLGTAVRDQIAPGLQALATAVQTQIAPGLQRVGDFVAAQEYGVVAIYTAAPGEEVDDSCCRTTSTVSPDIPDSGNTATASGTLPIQVSPSAVPPGGPDPTTYPNVVQQGAKVSLWGAIKSAEADGNATGDPAGQVGGLMTITCAGGGPAGNCGDGPGPAPEMPPGTVACVVGPTESNTFPIPGGSTTQNLRTIQEKSGLTDSTVPAFNFGPKLINVLENAQNEAGSGDASDGSCTMPSFGLWQVQIQTQFADIPTSASPGPKD